MILPRIVSAALVGFTLAGAAACSRREPPPPSSTAHATPTSPALTLEKPTTTAAEIALGNLDGEIADREKKARGGDAAASLELVSRYLTRAQFAGRVGDLAAADQASAKALAAMPNDPRAHLARASALSAVHEFAAANAELDLAAANKGDAEAIAAARAASSMATGRDDEAAALLPAGDDVLPRDLAVRGALASLRGDAVESERLFERARTRYRDVSPFFVAWMDFERARALLRGGDRARARAYFAEAAAVLPTYAHAVVHLASLDAPQAALPRLEALAKTSDDPDVLAALADVLRRMGRADDAKAKAEQARARFEELLAKFPKAFADHAASFYLGIGSDPGRALALAKANAENRPTEEAIELWLTAAQVAGAKDDACAAAAKARTLRHASKALADRAEHACR